MRSFDIVVLTLFIRFIFMEDLESLYTGKGRLFCLERIIIFPVVGQYIHKLFLYVSA